MQVKTETIDKSLLNSILFADEDLIKGAGVDDSKRCLPESIMDKIESVDMVTLTSAAGKIQRIVTLNMIHNYGVTGRPSVSASAINDRVTIGTKIALQNAINELWPLEGYLKCHELYVLQQNRDVIDAHVREAIELLGRRMEGEFGEKVGSFVRQYTEGNYYKIQVR